MVRWMRSGRPRAFDGVSWRALGASDDQMVTELARTCDLADGGRPNDNRAGFWLRAKSTTAVGGFVDGNIVAAMIIWSLLGTQRADGYVDPAFRGRGLGGALLDWGLSQRGPLAVTTRTLTADKQRLFASRHLNLGASVVNLSRPLGSAPPRPVPPPRGVTIDAWDPFDAYGVYVAAFADLPLNPYAHDEVLNNDYESWQALNDDLALTVQASAVARDLDRTPVGFVSAHGGGLYQFGVSAHWRRRGLGHALLSHALARVDPMSEDDTSVRVNAANRAAMLLLQAAGFEIGGREDYFVAF